MYSFCNHNTGEIFISNNIKQIYNVVMSTYRSRQSGREIGEYTTQDLFIVTDCDIVVWWIDLMF